MLAEPQGQGILLIGQGQRARRQRNRLDLAAQRVQGGELLGGDLVPGQPGQAGVQGLGGVTERVGRPGGGRRRVIDLVGETRGERAQSDQRLSLPGRGLDGPRGAVQPWMRCLPNGNQVLTFWPSTAAGTRSTRPPTAPRPVAR
jgi:hypothetical protein